MFVAEKCGRILVFDGMSDTTPKMFADLRTQVHDFWDRGLLGLALDPDFHNGRPYVYVAVHVQKDPRSREPARAGPTTARTRPGGTGDGCVVSGRLSPAPTTAPSRCCVQDWCQQFPSHSVGDLAFGADGALYVSGGDGASFNFADYGQGGNPRTLRRPAGRRGGADAADRRGRRAALPGPAHARRPDRRSAAPILQRRPGHRRRRWPATRPHGSDPNARRIIAIGLRNPFRFACRPGTSELWIGDVGWNSLGGDQPHPHDRRTACATSAGRATRAPPPGGVRRAQPDAVRGAVHRRRRQRARSRLPTTRQRVVPGRVVPDRAARRSPASRSTTARELPGRVPTARCSSPTTRATASG